MKKEESNKEANFPISVIELKGIDIEDACYTFDEDVQEMLKGLSWDAILIDKIVERLRSQLVHEYHSILPDTIKEFLKDEIEDWRTKRSFLDGLKEYIRRKK